MGVEESCRSFDPTCNNFAVAVDKLYIGPIGRQLAYALEPSVARAQP